LVFRALHTLSPLDYFRHEYFGPYDHYLGWHDGYRANEAALDALTPADRTTAETELCDSLRTGLADPRAIIGLGYLCSRQALPLLHSYLSQAGIYALEAIARVDPKGLDADHVLRILSSPKASQEQLFDLAIGLGHFFTLPQLDPRLVTQLLALLANRHFLVRTHALTALRRLHLLPDPKAYEGGAIAPADVRSDTLFDLISSDGNQADFRRAQQLLQAQMTAATPPNSADLKPMPPPSPGAW
jgi:hypothetical protein